ncbi:MAG: hypothetical protein K9M11_04845 [Candidatus Pacebacteria bacterium]|nr:hypothetical protein [Candidatus Paceibacterota bacterium]
MKTKLFRLVLALVAFVVLPSCDIYTGPQGEFLGAGFQGVNCGTFGDGTGRSYQPIGGTVIAGGSIVAGGLCSPGGPFIRGGGGFRPLPNQWGQVNPYGRQTYPYGSRMSPGHPSNYCRDPNLDRFRQRFPGSPCPGVLGRDGRWY